MINKFDISSFVNVPTVNSVTRKLVERVKKRRREVNLSQAALAKRSGVSYASVRRFEATGEISLTSLMRLADAIGCLDDFGYLFKNEIIKSLKDYEND